MSSPFIGQQGEFLYRGPAGLGLGFGSAGLMRLPARRQRQRLLAEAFDCGVRHFDVARMYGMGAAEGELGRFARGRRGQISIATKFGIDPGGAGRLARLQAPVRAAVARLPALRAALKRRDGAFHQARRYDPALARASLETSLRELGTDYVDLFLVHDPGPGDRVEMGELGEALEELRRDGKIRAWGISGEPRPCVELRGEAGGDAILQVHDDIFSPPLGADGGRLIAFGVVAAALARIRSHLAQRPQRRAEWSEALGVDCGDSEALAALLLQDALDRHAAGGVLFATGSPARVRAASAAARALAAGEPPALGAFRNRVGAELGAGDLAGV